MFKIILVIVVMILLSIPKIIHKNSKNISTEKVHFQETFIMKGEDNLCHYFIKGDTTIKMGKTYETLDDCIRDGGELVKPNINKK
jgi:hypothetical protein